MSAYVLTVAKSGAKLAVSQGEPGGYETLLGVPQRGMKGQNLSMAAFASRLQSGILDRPVVDQNGLKGRYDFVLKWTPDETQFRQTGARFPASGDGVDVPPGLFTAIQEELGLRLLPVKTLVDVLVVDDIQRPSEN